VVSANNCDKRGRDDAPSDPKADAPAPKSVFRRENGVSGNYAWTIRLKFAGHLKALPVLKNTSSAKSFAAAGLAVFKSWSLKLVRCRDW
jgi:hypothetical protein